MGPKDTPHPPSAAPTESPMPGVPEGPAGRTHTWLSGRATSREMLVFSSWLRMATASSRFWTSTPLICDKPRDHHTECQGWLWGRPYPSGASWARKGS